MRDQILPIEIDQPDRADRLGPPGLAEGEANGRTITIADYLNRGNPQ